MFKCQIWIAFECHISKQIFFYHNYLLWNVHLQKKDFLFKYQVCNALDICFHDYLYLQNCPAKNTDFYYNACLYNVCTLK